MRRSILIAVCGAAALASALPGHAWAAAGVAKGPSVKLLTCTPEEHSAVYQGRMASVAGTDHMAMRFVLLGQVPGKVESRVRVPALSRWRRSKPEVGSFGWKQELLNLGVGATYRVQVEFRWFDAEGTVIRSVRKRSVVCRQFSDLPNLRVQLLNVADTTTPGVRRYRVRIENAGAATAIGAVLQLSVDGVAAQQQRFGALAAGESRTVGLLGPPCQGFVQATADPDNLIAEVSEADNAHSFACADLARRR